jgi:hypothetical protein
MSLMTSVTPQQLGSFALALGGVAATHWGVEFLVRRRGVIAQGLHITSLHVSDVLNIFRTCVSCALTIYFFKSPKMPLSTFCNVNCGWLLGEAFKSVSNLSELASWRHTRSVFSSNTVERYTWVKRLTYPIQMPTQSRYVRAVWMTVQETVIFRGLIQTLLLRELPRYVLKVTDVASPAIVDSRYMIGLRVVCVTALLLLAKTGAGRTKNNAYEAGIMGCNFSALHERVSPLAACIPHLAYNLTQTVFP